jgi:hypothetical protein
VAELETKEVIRLTRENVRKTGFLLLIILVTLAAGAHAFAGKRKEVGGVESDPAAAQRIFQLLNQARRKAGLPALSWNSQLARAALAHTGEMVSNDALSHQFSGEPTVFNRLAQTGESFDRSGENIAFAGNAEMVHDALMHSPPHRENILSPNFNAVGVGAVRNGQNLFFTQDFAHLFSKMTDSDLADRLAGEVRSLRSQAGLRTLARKDGAALARDACEMAHQDQLAAEEITSPGAIYLATFTMLDPKDIPGNARKFAKNNDITAYAVGSCFARTKIYPAGVYWVIMAFYRAPTARAGR